MLPPPMRRTAGPAILFFLCCLSVNGLDLAVDASDELWPCWERLASAFPLPPGIRAVRAVPGVSTNAGQVILGIGPAPGRKPVERCVLAPVSRMWGSRGSVSLAEARSAEVRLAPLESIVLPDVALAVDGLFPDQPGYPLVDDLGVSVRSADRSILAWFDALPTALSRGASEPATIAWIGAVGDVMPARGVDAALLASGGLSRVFGDTLPLLRGCDFLLGNLEAAATSAGTRIAKTYAFRFNPAALGRLREAGFSYFSIANNHTFDFGEKGFLDTRENLARWGLGASGAGRNEAEAALPFAVTIKGADVRVLSLADYPVDRTGFDGRKTARAALDSPGTLWLDDAGLSAVSRASSSGSFTIVMVHGGVEWDDLPAPGQKNRYRQLVDAGADLVIGSHPHVLQGMEARGGNLIAYSLGNFLFPGMEGTKGGTSSLLLRVGVFQGRIRYVTPIPVRLAGVEVRRAEGSSPARGFLDATRVLGAGR